MDACKDAGKCHLIIKSYKDHRKVVDSGARLPSSWPLMEVKMLFIKRTSTDIKAEGELMNRRRFLQWSTACFVIRQHHIIDTDIVFLKTKNTLSIICSRVSVCVCVCLWVLESPVFSVNVLRRLFGFCANTKRLDHTLNRSNANRFMLPRIVRIFRCLSIHLLCAFVCFFQH